MLSQTWISRRKTFKRPGPSPLPLRGRACLLTEPPISKHRLTAPLDVWVSTVPKRPRAHKLHACTTLRSETSNALSDAEIDVALGCFFWII